MSQRDIDMYVISFNMISRVVDAFPYNRVNRTVTDRKLEVYIFLHSAFSPLRLISNIAFVVKYSYFVLQILSIKPLYEIILSYTYSKKYVTLYGIFIKFVKSFRV